MLRNLLAIIIATLAGFVLIKNLEVLAIVHFAIDVRGALRGDNSIYFIFAGIWFLGAFFAALIALIIGRRWAPLGIWAAATIFFSAVLALLRDNPEGIFMWFIAAAATATGGWLAVKLLKAKSAYPQAASREKIFDD